MGAAGDFGAPQSLHGSTLELPPKPGLLDVFCGKVAEKPGFELGFEVSIMVRDFPLVVQGSREIYRAAMRASNKLALCAEFAALRAKKCPADKAGLSDHGLLTRRV